MAVCLQRAAELERAIIDKMSAMEAATAFLEDLTEIESDVIAEFQNNTSGHAYELTGKTTSAGTSYLDLLRSNDVGILNNTQHYVRNDATYSNQDILYDDFIAKIESKMDEKNTFSQKTMIELQSLTAKRDQSYDMISNVLKSLNSVLVGNANNM